MAKILLLGANGQVGWELQRSLAPLGEVIALGHRASPKEQALGYCGDLLKLTELRACIQAIRPNIIVNAAAYTAVDKAESEPELAHTVNALAPEVLAQEAAALGAWLLHYSTDYVFDGRGQKAWQETDCPAPLSVYGASKLAGEQRIQACTAQYLIFRTSWVYAARGANFAKTMLRLGQERDQLSVVADQYGAPTGAELLADVSAHAIRQAMSQTAEAGVYHVAASGTTTWHEYATYVIEMARQNGVTMRVNAGHILPISSVDFPTPAQRPCNSRLDTSHFQTQFKLQLPHWQLGVARMLQEIIH